LGIVKAKVVVKGSKSSIECIALVNTGAAMTVIDREVADAIGVMYTGRRRSLVSATGHKLEGEIVIIKELNIEG